MHEQPVDLLKYQFRQGWRKDTEFNSYKRS